MVKYNLYYGTKRINSKSLTDAEIKAIMSTQAPVRKMENGQLVEIPLNKIRVVRCTIV